MALTDYGRPKLNFGINPLFVAAGMMALGVPSSLEQAGGPQSQASAQTAAAETRLPVFAVASVRQNESPASPFKLAFTSDGVTIEKRLVVVNHSSGLRNVQYPRRQVHRSTGLGQ